jgi:peptide/nickel transport system permease protein
MSVAAQLGNYLWRLVRSISASRRSMASRSCDVILERLPATHPADGFGIAVVRLLRPACVLGVIAARRVNRWPDTLISTLGLIFYATPSFWFGLMAIVCSRFYLQWLPPGGFETSARA